MLFCQKKFCVLTEVILDIKTKEHNASRPLRLCVRDKYVLMFFCQKNLCAILRANVIHTIPKDYPSSDFPKAKWD